MSDVPLFVTLTYPDQFPLYHGDYKHHLDLLGQQVLRRWPGASIVWKLEFKERRSGENAGKLAPHYHLFVYGVPWMIDAQNESGGNYSLRLKHTLTIESEEIECWNQEAWTSKGVLESRAVFVKKQLKEGEIWENGDTFKEWIRRHWFDIVGSDNIKHYKAGTRVEKLRNFNGAIAYASKKYAGKPVDCANLEHKPGRFWGVIGRKNLPRGEREVIEITPKQAAVIMRAARRSRRSRAKKPEDRRKLRFSHYDLKLYCDVEGWRRYLESVLRPIQIRLMASEDDKNVQGNSSTADR